jgi:hypothetical protein
MCLPNKTLWITWASMWSVGQEGQSTDPTWGHALSLSLY